MNKLSIFLKLEIKYGYLNDLNLLSDTNSDKSWKIILHLQE